MRSTQQLSVTLPDDMAANVRAKVTSGEYASESEVVREGLRALQERDHAIDDWLRNEVVPAYEALKSDPSSGLSSDEIRAGLRERYGTAAKTHRT